MAARLRMVGEHLRTFWETQPIIFISVALGVTGPAMVYLSPWSKQQDEELAKFPMTYPWDQVKDWKRKGVTE